MALLNLPVFWLLLLAVLLHRSRKNVVELSLTQLISWKTELCFFLVSLPEKGLLARLVRSHLEKERDQVQKLIEISGTSGLTIGFMPSGGLYLDADNNIIIPERR